MNARKTYILKLYVAGNTPNSMRALNTLREILESEFKEVYALKVSDVLSLQGGSAGVNKLRSGENPHQEAALYANISSPYLNQLHGKKLSYNNYNDIFASLSLTKTLPKNRGTVIVKHTNPSGVSIENDHLKSYFSAGEEGENIDIIIHLV